MPRYAGVIALGMVLSLKGVALAATGTTFDGADEMVANSGMKLVYWLMLAGLLGIAAFAFQVHFSPGVLMAIVGLLFVSALIASHSGIAGLVGVTAAAEFSAPPPREILLELP